ncbi:MAG TPA: ATP-binding cassette domain-containing protein [Thermomonospora sp.]|nr:ATP-binding cassette domain-containing protein [Thermomonospora sp.]
MSFVSCDFGYRRGSPVFHGLDFVFPPGRTVLLGPNGAGKSTLLGLAASLFLPTAGSVSYRGLDPSRRRDRSGYRRLVGWMPQNIAPIPGLTVREQVSYAGWLKGLSRREAWRRAPAALEAVELSPLGDRRCSLLSGGQLRRVGLAQTLVHDAEVILLDEPTAGLDPRQRERFRQIVLGVGEHRHIIVSTHQTEDLTDLYSSVVVLDKGTVRYSGPTSGFLALSQRERPSVEDAYARLVTGET